MKRTNPERPFTGKNLAGQKVGRWSVLEFSHYVRREVLRGGGKYKVSSRYAFWRCLCACGNARTIGGAALRAGTSQSCGCLQVEWARAHNTIHGSSKSPIYRSWCEMRTRCTNPRRDSWKNYGGRGIQICKRWKSFVGFKQDMQESWKPGLSLHRKDNDGNYSPQNCKWATAIEQANNKSTSKKLSAWGRTHTVAEWAREFGISPFTLYHRIKAGFAPEIAIAKMRMKKRNK